MKSDGLLLTALSLLSAAVTAQQVALMQVLGWMHWHHFAYMIVAIALLGFGMAGTVLSLARERLLACEPIALRWLFLLTAAAIPLGVHLAQLDSFAVDLPLVFFDPAENAWRLAGLCLLLLPPFFFGGLATGLILTAHVSRAGRYYSASLVGAGLGGLLGLTLVAHISPPRLPAATATVAFLATLCLLLDRSAAQPQARKRASRAIAAVVCLIAVYLSAMWLWPVQLKPSQFKPLSRSLDLPGAKIIASSPSVHGWIQIVDAPALRPAPAVSFAFAGEVPPHPAIFINGLGYGSLLNAEATRNPHWLDFTTDAVAFVPPTAPGRVLLLENGPGGWAALAVARSATRVTVAEANQELVELLTNDEPPLAPEWRLPGVRLATSSGRDFLQRTTESFDVIRFPSVGELGGSAGLVSTSEQFLLTQEAFFEAWRHLTSDGVIAVTAWMDFPERNTLRLLATLVETAATAGVAAREHLVAVRGWATVTFLLRRSAWSTEDTVALRAFCDERSFDPLLLPQLQGDERDNYHVWQNPRFFDLVDRIVDGPRDTTFSEHPFLLRPTTDDQPYFSQFLRWNAWDQMSATFGARTMPFFELGSLTVALTFLILTLLGMGGIILPLAGLGWRTPGKTRVFLYFGGLGAGFMFVEIGLMLSAHAWLGSPVVAASVVLTALLIASGIGSLWSERWTAGAREQQRALLVIAVGIAVVAVLLSALAPVARTWSVGAQLALLLCLVAPLGTAMGIAFPLGLRRLEWSAPAQIPWAWAINGCVSVATPAAAMLLAMSAGFTALFIAAGSAYGIAWLSVALATTSASPIRPSLAGLMQLRVQS